MKRKRYKCPECGKMTMTIKQKEGTNACGKCEISELPANLPQKLVCWNKYCLAEFTGKMYNHKKYTLCPKCKKLAQEVGQVQQQSGSVFHDTKNVEVILDAYADDIIPGDFFAPFGWQAKGGFVYGKNSR